jgi:hypothetical protein
MRGQQPAFAKAIDRGVDHGTDVGADLRLASRERHVRPPS